MIVVVNRNAAKEQFDNLVSWIESQNVRVHISPGEYQTVLGLIGDTSRIDTELLEGLDIVRYREHQAGICLLCLLYLLQGT